MNNNEIPPIFETEDSSLWIRDPKILEFKRREKANQHANKVINSSERVEQAGRILEAPLAGDKLPWSHTHKRFRFRQKEQTIWSGKNSAGKSLMLGQVTLSLLQQSKRIVMISLEMPGDRTLSRMLRQAAGTPNPTRLFEKQFASWIDGKFFIYDEVTSLNPESALDLIYYCSKEYKADHIIIDSFMKINSGADSFKQQKALLEALAQAPKDLDNHLHLVAHFGKPNHGQQVDRYQIKGPTEISDLADNVMLMSRNMKKAREMEKPEAARNANKIAEADGHMLVDKQRNGEWVGNIPLWFHRESHQYVGYEDARAIDFMRERTDEEEAEIEREAIQTESRLIDDDY